MIKPNGLMMCSKVFWNNDCVQRKYVQLMKIWDHKEIRIKTEIRNRFWKNDYNKFNSVTSVIIVLKVCTLFVKIVLKQMKKRRKKPWSLTWRHCSHKYGNKALKYPDFFFPEHSLLQTLTTQCEEWAHTAVCASKIHIK